MARRRLSRDGGAFGIWWFWYAVLGMVSVTAVVLVSVSFWKEAQLTAIARSEAAKFVEPAVTAPPRYPVVAFMGDSYTAGAGASDAGHRFAALVAARQGWIEKNFGRGGTGYVLSITDPAVAKIACNLDRCPNFPQMIPDAGKVNPDIVFVSGGRNDSTLPTGPEGPAIRAFFTQLHKAVPHAKIIATSPIWDSSTVPDTIAPMRDEVKSAVQAVGGTFLDIGEPLQGHPDWISGDHIHPTDAGHAAIAAAIEAKL